MKVRPTSALERRQLSGPLLEPLTAGVQGWLDGFVVYVSSTLVAHIGGVVVVGLVIGGTGFASLETWTRPGLDVSASELVIAGLLWLLLALASMLFVAVRATADAPFRPGRAELQRRLPAALWVLLLVNAPLVGLAGAAAALSRWSDADPVIATTVAIALGIAWTTLTWFLLPAALIGQRPLRQSLAQGVGLARRRWISIAVTVAAIIGLQLVWTVSLVHFLASDLTTHAQARVWGILVLSLVQAAVLGSLIVVSTVRLYMQLSTDVEETVAPAQKESSTKRNAAA